MELDLLSSRINLNHTCLKLQISIEDIKTKHPNRTDLITSMEQSLHEIKKAMVVYGTLEKEFRVGSASKLDVGIMSRALGVYPVRINSKLVTAQLQDRYYWSNIKTKETMFDLVTDIPQPKDKGIMFKDIVTNGTELSKSKSNCLTEREYKKIRKMKLKKHIENKDLQKENKHQI
jgi:hypothetical protein